MSPQKPPDQTQSKSIKAAGDLDPGFGVDGLVNIPNPEDPNAFLYISAITTNPTTDTDNALYVGCWLNETYIVRLLQDGQIDTSFGSAGYAKLPKGEPTNHSLNVGSFTFLETGNVIGLGSIHIQESGYNLNVPAAVGFTSDGIIDTSFGDGGISIFRLHLPTPESASHQTSTNEKSESTPCLNTDIHKAHRNGHTDASQGVRLADGKLLFVGSTYYSNSPILVAAYLIRINADGSLDTSFGQNGSVVIRQFEGNDTHNTFFGIDRQNRVFIAGNPGLIPFPASIVRYEAEGNIDTSFGNNGVVYLTLPDSPGSQAMGMIVLDDGKVIVLANFFKDAFSPATTAVVQLSPSGTPDPEFNNGEPVSIVLTQGGTFAGSTISKDEGNRIVISGSREKPGEISSGCMVRLMPNGQLDTGFGSNGTAVFERFETVDLTTIQNRVNVVTASSDIVSLEGLLFRIIG